MKYFITWLVLSWHPLKQQGYVKFASQTGCVESEHKFRVFNTYDSAYRFYMHTVIRSWADQLGNIKKEPVITEVKIDSVR